MHRAILATFVALVLADCSADREARWAQSGKTQLIGFSQSRIRMCAGFPANTAKDGASEIWMYEHATSSPGGQRTLNFDILPGLASGNAPPAGYCRMQMRFIDGKVTEIQYAGATDINNTRDAACGQLVRNCLPPRDQQ